MTESSSSHDTIQDSRKSLKGTNGSEEDHVQSLHDSPLSGGHTSDRADGALNLEELFSICTNLSNRVLVLKTVKDAQAAEIIALKARIKQLEKKCKPSISHHRAWLKSVQRLSMKKRFGMKEFVSKQGRKKDKPEPTLDDSTFDGLDADLNANHDMVYMDTEEPVNKRRLNKGKGVLEEPEPANKMTRSDLDAAQIAKDAEVARLVYEEKLAELERENKKRHREEEASKAAMANMYDEVQEGIEADALFNIGGYKYSQLKANTFAEIQGLYERQKRVIDDFKPMDSDDAIDKKKIFEEPDSTKVEVKQEGDKESIKKRPARRLMMKAIKKSKRQKTDSDLKKEEHLKTSLQIVPNEEGEVDYEVLYKRFPIIKWESKFYHLDRHRAECIYYRIFSSDGSSRWIKTFSKMVTGFDMMDLEKLYNLVMQRFETTSPEGVDLVLWCDLRTMFEEIADDDLWKNQEEWSSNFYENCEVHTLTLEDGNEIYMLAERRYPLTKETLERMLPLRLIAESESEAVFDLLRFIQKQINESESHDGSEKDLKELASPKQTDLGKDISNPLIVDSLLKTIWLSVHHVIAMKHWLFQSKRLLRGNDVVIKRITHVLQGKLQNKNTWGNLCTKAIKLAYLHHSNFVAFYGVVLDGLSGLVAMPSINFQVLSGSLFIRLLDLVVWFHELKDEGYEIDQDSKLITVFSAPNYCDQTRKHGGNRRSMSVEFDPKKNKAGSKINLPPGSFGWPFLGESLSLLRTSWAGEPERFFKERIEKHAWWPFPVRKLFGRCLITIRGDEAKWMRKMLLSYLGPDAFATHYAVTMDVVTRRHIEAHWR
nr:beta-amyrin 28-oxidase-like [Tanacetum cinerariifolium]